MLIDDQIIDSFTLDQRGDRLSPDTIRLRVGTARIYVAWCAENELPPELTRPAAAAFKAHLVDLGRSGNTVKTRHEALKVLSRWLAKEYDVPDVLHGDEAPKVDETIIEPLTDEQVLAMLATCDGTFRGKRDEAIIRLMRECGPRATETATILLSDTKVLEGETVIRRGKGGKGRRISFGPQTARSIDRYLRLRKNHPLARTDRLWLGDRGRGFAYDGLYTALAQRAERAEVPDFFPHRLRHTFADRWLDAGGSESGLMAIGGWARGEMIDRYTRARRTARALAEAQRLNLGDL